MMSENDEGSRSKLLIPPELFAEIKPIYEEGPPDPRVFPDVSEIVKLDPETRKAVEEINRRATVGDADTIRAGFVEKVGPPNEVNRVVIEKDPAFVAEENYVFVRSDQYPGLFAQVMLEHEAVEGVYQHRPDEAQKLVRSLRLGGFQRKSRDGNENRPAHWVAMAHELLKADEYGILDEYLSFRDGRAQEQLDAIEEPFPEVIEEVANTQRARQFIAQSIRIHQTT